MPLIETLAGLAAIITQLKEHVPGFLGSMRFMRSEFMRRNVLPRLVAEFRASAPTHRTFKHTQWFYEPLGESPADFIPRRNQWIHARVAMIGADGQAWALEFPMPTGRRYDRAKFIRRMNAELAREAARAGRPVADPSAYVRNAIWHVDFYAVTLEPLGA